MIKKIFTGGLTIAFTLIFGVNLSADTYSQNDINRIVYIAKVPPHFRVVKKVSGSRITCTVLGQKNKSASNFNEKLLVKTDFFENSSLFDITTGALLQGQMREKRYLLPLVKEHFANCDRIKLLIESEKEEKKFLQAIKANVRKPDYDEWIDSFYDVLNSSQLNKFVIAAANNKDWILALHLYERYYKNMLVLARKDSKKTSLYMDVMAEVEKLQKDLLTKFNQQNARKSELYLKYIQVANTWKYPEIKKINDLQSLFARSKKSYNALITDQVRPGNFPEWSSHMLNLLILCEHNQISESARADFNRHVDIMLKKKSQRK